MKKWREDLDSPPKRATTFFAITVFALAMRRIRNFARRDGRKENSFSRAKPAASAETHSRTSHRARDPRGMEHEMNLKESTPFSSDQSAASLAVSPAASPSPPAREVCRDFLKGACFRESCRYAHDAAEGAALPTQTTQPICRDYQNGRCFRASCRFYHGTTAEQVAMGLGDGNRLFSGSLSPGLGMYGGGSDMNSAEDIRGRNPQLHLLNRTLNLPLSMVMNHGGQMDPSILFSADASASALGGNLSLEQALLVQNMLAMSANSGQNSSAAMMNAVAVANEILRRNADMGQQMASNGNYDSNWMHAQMAATAAALAQQQAITQQLTRNQPNGIFADREATVTNGGAVHRQAVEMAFAAMGDDPLRQNSMDGAYAAWSALNSASAREQKVPSHHDIDFSLPESIYDTSNAVPYNGDTSFKAYNAFNTGWSMGDS